MGHKCHVQGVSWQRGACCGGVQHPSHPGRTAALLGCRANNEQFVEHHCYNHWLGWKGRGFCQHVPEALKFINTGFVMCINCLRALVPASSVCGSAEGVPKSLALKSWYWFSPNLTWWSGEPLLGSARQNWILPCANRHLLLSLWLEETLKKGKTLPQGWGRGKENHQTKECNFVMVGLRLCWQNGNNISWDNVNVSHYLSDTKQRLILAGVQCWRLLLPVTGRGRGCWRSPRGARMQVCTQGWG